ncbi:MAG: hypothetical protein ACRDK0_03995 [Solirubrobacteraceae bacterium]
MFAVRYVLPAGLALAGFVILFTVDGSLRWEGWAMCVGSGLSVFFLNWLFRLGARGDEERRDEEAARDYLTEHGHWPDEPPPKR